MREQISDEMLDSLRNSLKTKMSGFRLAHTFGVEEMARRIGEIYCPEKVNMLRAAALLHDITKELSTAEHKEIFSRHGMEMSREMEEAYPTQHAASAALEIPDRYPEFSDGEIVDAVRYHTTGRADMSLCEKIIYLSDYIDSTRTYSDCILLREMFWGADPENMTQEERLLHLDRVVLKSFELTIDDLRERGRPISRETAQARDFLQKQIQINEAK